MILIDANLLLYAYNKSSEAHPSAQRWLEETLAEPQLIRFSWTTILAFLRIITNPRIFPLPFTAIEAGDIVSDWLKQPAVSILNPGDRHWSILNNLISTAQVQGPLVMDAHLAALAIEHGATLLTTDQDFSRFKGLKWKNPLQS